jgi:phosphomannomutase
LTDGLSLEFEQWRFNVRSSNTEPVVRLNVESRANPTLMQEKTDAILAMLGGDPA